MPDRRASGRAPRESRKSRGSASSPLRPRAAPQRPGAARAARDLAGEHEIDAARLEVHPHDFHFHPVREAIDLAGPVAEKLVLGRVEVEVVLPELGDVHQALDVEIIERDEDAEASNRPYRTLG